MCNFYPNLIHWWNNIGNLWHRSRLAVRSFDCIMWSKIRSSILVQKMYVPIFTNRFVIYLILVFSLYLFFLYIIIRLTIVNSFYFIFSPKYVKLYLRVGTQRVCESCFWTINRLRTKLPMIFLPSYYVLIQVNVLSRNRLLPVLPKEIV